MTLLQLEDVKASFEEKQILKGVSFALGKGEVVALMGPNGSGKSTLAHVLMGDPRYEVEGKAVYAGENLFQLEPDERSRKGMFLSFQQPREIPGVRVSAFFRAILRAHAKLPSPEEFLEEARNALRTVGLPEEVLEREVNVGFSGGERKRLELAQMLLLKPRLVILDEIDSGLDVDALRVVARVVNALRDDSRSFLIITHYSRILHHVNPDRVLIMREGRLAREGPARLAWEIEEKGYGLLEEAASRTQSRGM